MSGVIVGIDGSNNSSRALDWAVAEAAMRDADLTVVAVNSVPESHWSRQPVPWVGDAERVEQIQKSAQDALSKAAGALGDRQPKSVTVIAVNGYPAQTLIDKSATADLMVVGSRGGGGFAELFLGSTSSQVVHHAKCPIVVVPVGR